MGQRLLMYTDNVDEPSQVKCVQPAGAGSVVIVATSSDLDELIADGAFSVPVRPMVYGEARELLTAVLSPVRPMPTGSEIRELAEACGGLPVALNVCAAQLVLHPRMTVRDLLARINAASDRLSGLPKIGGHSVWATFEMAYRELEAPLGEFYRRLGLFPGLSLTAAPAARLAEVRLEDASEYLEELGRRHLVEADRRDRYSIHSLVHDHMRTTTTRDDDEPTRHRVVASLADWYLRVLRSADEAVVQDRMRLSPHTMSSPAGAPELSSPSDSFAWFEEERRNVLSVMELAVEHELHEVVWQCAEALWPLCSTQSCYGAWIRADQLGVQAANACGDLAAESSLRAQLARAHAELGDHRQASREINEAFSGAFESGHALLCASVTESSGVCALLADDIERALEAFGQAYEQMDRLGVHRGVAIIDYLRAKALIRTDRPDDALAALDAAEARFAELDDRVSLGKVGRRRCEALLAMGLHSEASAEAEKAARVLQALGMSVHQAEVRRVWGSALRAAGRSQAASKQLREAYQLLRAAGHPEADRLEAELG